MFLVSSVICLLPPCPLPPSPGLLVQPLSSCSSGISVSSLPLQLHCLLSLRVLSARWHLLVTFSGFCFVLDKILISFPCVQGPPCSQKLPLLPLPCLATCSGHVIWKPPSLYVLCASVHTCHSSVVCRVLSCVQLVYVTISHSLFMRQVTITFSMKLFRTL